LENIIKRGIRFFLFLQLEWLPLLALKMALEHKLRFLDRVHASYLLCFGPQLLIPKTVFCFRQVALKEIIGWEEK